MAESERHGLFRSIGENFLRLQGHRDFVASFQINLNVWQERGSFINDHRVKGNKGVIPPSVRKNTENAIVFLPFDVIC
jgi:hypothetical protein